METGTTPADCECQYGGCSLGGSVVNYYALSRSTLEGQDWKCMLGDLQLPSNVRGVCVCVCVCVSSSVAGRDHTQQTLTFSPSLSLCDYKATDTENVIHKTVSHNLLI